MRERGYAGKSRDGYLIRLRAGLCCYMGNMDRGVEILALREPLACTSARCDDRVPLQMAEYGVVGFPPVGEFDGDVEMHRGDGGVGVEEMGDAGAGDDDAGVPVT